ncbi:MAG: type II toxin-antitoxin system VapC family toxin [Stenomitos rutilans HA7619-LM2]|jgi:PIN domain nuclease of toxin-antitoxin system|nr:type II toxin-antitoxin system VapC family toxin [Stenomitos rutilans HA7619-LM2]
MLLDTHTLLWFLDDDPQLPSVVRERIENADTSFVSIVSLWEIAIKISIGKLRLNYSFHDLQDLLDRFEIEVLPLAFTDIEQYLNLPLHHRDPFDRMLIAQAMSHDLTLISRDEQFDAYSIQRSRE